MKWTDWMNGPTCLVWVPSSDGAAARTTFSQDGRRVAVIAAHVKDSQLVEVLKVWNTESNSVEPIFS